MAQQHQGSSGAAITIHRVRAMQAGRLRLASAGIDGDGRIDDLHSGYHDNLSPPLQWTAMPDADTFALVVEDPDAPTDLPALHWAMWNIPGTLQSLPRGLRPAPRLDEFGGAVQGRNSHGEFGYLGPMPPAGDGPHRYHFQLFALDLRLALGPNAPLQDLVQLLKARAIADGELIGTYERQDLQPGAGRTDRLGAIKPSERSFASHDPRGGLDEDDVDRHAPHSDDGAVRPPT